MGNSEINLFHCVDPSSYLLLMHSQKVTYTTILILTRKVFKSGDYYYFNYLICKQYVEIYGFHVKFSWEIVVTIHICKFVRYFHKI